ncbi:hypothetical protein Lal_00014870 [Lupinus albus]|nr:hypothetical protein Lal_00014870 [Lupinus albus]
MVQPRAPRRGDGRHEEPDRLDPAGTGRRPPQPGPHARRHAGVRRFAIVQRGQHAAPPGPLDAHVHDPEPVVGADGVQGIRRRRPHAPVRLLRPRRRRDGRAVQVHLAAARPHGLPHGPLQRAQRAGAQGHRPADRQAVEAVRKDELSRTQSPVVTISAVCPRTGGGVDRPRRARRRRAGRPDLPGRCQRGAGKPAQRVARHQPRDDRPGRQGNARRPAVPRPGRHYHRGPHPLLHQRGLHGRRARGGAVPGLSDGRARGHLQQCHRRRRRDVLGSGVRERARRDGIERHVGPPRRRRGERGLRQHPHEPVSERRNPRLAGRGTARAGDGRVVDAGGRSRRPDVDEPEAADGVNVLIDAGRHQSLYTAAHAGTAARQNASSDPAAPTSSPRNPAACRNAATAPASSPGRTASAPVGTAHDVRHALLGIVHDDGQLVRPVAVRTLQDEIAGFAGQPLRDDAGHAVLERDHVRARLRHAQAQAARTAARREAMAARAGIDRGAVRRDAEARIGDLAAVAAARVHVAGEAVVRRLVQMLAAALPHDLAVGRHAQALQQVEDLFGGAGHAAAFVDVFDAHQPGALVGARIEIAGQRGDERPGMQRARGRGCEAADIAALGCEVHWRNLSTRPRLDPVGQYCEWQAYERDTETARPRRSFPGRRGRRTGLVRRAPAQRAAHLAGAVPRTAAEPGPVDHGGRGVVAAAVVATRHAALRGSHDRPHRRLPPGGRRGVLRDRGTAAARHARGGAAGVRGAVAAGPRRGPAAPDPRTRQQPRQRRPVPQLPARLGTHAARATGRGARDLHRGAAPVGPPECRPAAGTMGHAGAPVAPDVQDEAGPVRRRRAGAVAGIPADAARAARGAARGQGARDLRRRRRRLPRLVRPPLPGRAAAVESRAGGAGPGAVRLAPAPAASIPGAPRDSRKIRGRDRARRPAAAGRRGPRRDADDVVPHRRPARLADAAAPETARIAAPDERAAHRVAEVHRDGAAHHAPARRDPRRRSGLRRHARHRGRRALPVPRRRAVRGIAVQRPSARDGSRRAGVRRPCSGRRRLFRAARAHRADGAPVRVPRVRHRVRGAPAEQLHHAGRRLRPGATAGARLRRPAHPRPYLAPRRHDDRRVPRRLHRVRRGRTGTRQAAARRAAVPPGRTGAAAGARLCAPRAPLLGRAAARDRRRVRRRPTTCTAPCRIRSHDRHGRHALAVRAAARGDGRHGDERPVLARAPAPPWRPVAARAGVGQRRRLRGPDGHGDVHDAVVGPPGRPGRPQADAAARAARAGRHAMVDRGDGQRGRHPLRAPAAGRPRRLHRGGAGLRRTARPARRARRADGAAAGRDGDRFRRRPRPRRLGLRRLGFHQREPVGGRRLPAVRGPGRVRPAGPRAAGRAAGARGVAQDAAAGRRRRSPARHRPGPGREDDAADVLRPVCRRGAARVEPRDGPVLRGHRARPVRGRAVLGAPLRAHGPCARARARRMDPVGLRRHRRGAGPRHERRRVRAGARAVGRLPRGAAARVLRPAVARSGRRRTGPRARRRQRRGQGRRARRRRRGRPRPRVGAAVRHVLDRRPALRRRGRGHARHPHPLPPLPTHPDNNRDFMKQALRPLPYLVALACSMWTPVHAEEPAMPEVVIRDRKIDADRERGAGRRAARPERAVAAGRAAERAGPVVLRRRRPARPGDDPRLLGHYRPVRGRRARRRPVLPRPLQHRARGSAEGAGLRAVRPRLRRWPRQPRDEEAAGRSAARSGRHGRLARPAPRRIRRRHGERGQGRAVPPDGRRRGFDGLPRPLLPAPPGPRAVGHVQARPRDHADPAGRLPARQAPGRPGRAQLPRPPRRRAGRNLFRRRQRHPARVRAERREKRHRDARPRVHARPETAHGAARVRLRPRPQLHVHRHHQGRRQSDRLHRPEPPPARRGRALPAERVGADGRLGHDEPQAAVRRGTGPPEQERSPPLAQQRGDVQPVPSGARRPARAAGQRDAQRGQQEPRRHRGPVPAGSRRPHARVEGAGRRALRPPEAGPRRPHGEERRPAPHGRHMVAAPRRRVPAHEPRGRVRVVEPLVPAHLGFVHVPRQQRHPEAHADRQQGSGREARPDGPLQPDGRAVRHDAVEHPGRGPDQHELLAARRPPAHARPGTELHGRTGAGLGCDRGLCEHARHDRGLDGADVGRQAVRRQHGRAHAAPHVQRVDQAPPARPLLGRRRRPRGIEPLRVAGRPDHAAGLRRAAIGRRLRQRQGRRHGHRAQRAEPGVFRVRAQRRQRLQPAGRDARRARQRALPLLTAFVAHWRHVRQLPSPAARTTRHGARHPRRPVSRLGLARRNVEGRGLEGLQRPDRPRGRGRRAHAAAGHVRHGPAPPHPGRRETVRHDERARGVSRRKALVRPGLAPRAAVRGAHDVLLRAELRKRPRRTLRHRHARRQPVLRGRPVARVVRGGRHDRRLVHADHDQRGRPPADAPLPQAGRRKARARRAAAGRRRRVAALPRSGSGAQLPAAVSGGKNEGVGGPEGARQEIPAALRAAEPRVILTRRPSRPRSPSSPRRSARPATAGNARSRTRPASCG